MIVDLAIAI